MKAWLCSVSGINESTPPFQGNVSNPSSTTLTQIPHPWVQAGRAAHGTSVRVTQARSG